MNDDSIADERDLSLPDDSRGQEVEVVRLVPHHNSVAGVVAALKQICDYMCKLITTLIGVFYTTEYWE